MILNKVDDLFSDINLLFYKVFGLGQSMEDYMVGLGPESPSGETSYYRSCDSQALGMLISAVSSLGPDSPSFFSASSVDNPFSLVPRSAKISSAVIW